MMRPRPSRERPRISINSSSSSEAVACRQRLGYRARRHIACRFVRRFERDFQSIAHITRLIEPAREFFPQRGPLGSFICRACDA